MVDTVESRKQNTPVPFLPAVPEQEVVLEEGERIPSPRSFKRWAQDMVSVLNTVLEQAQDALPLTGGTMSGDIDMDGNTIDNPADPTAGTHVGDRDFNDARYVELTGDTMTGALAMGNQILSGPLDPASGTHVGDRDFNDARYAQTNWSIPVAAGVVQTSSASVTLISTINGCTVTNISGAGKFKITLDSAASSQVNIGVVFGQMASALGAEIRATTSSTTVIDCAVLDTNDGVTAVNATFTFAVYDMGA